MQITLGLFDTNRLKKLDYNRPDIVLVDKQSKSCLIIGVACPNDWRVESKQEEKVNKYLNLAFEIKLKAVEDEKGKNCPNHYRNVGHGTKAVCDKRRLQTCRTADSQTCRLADLQTGRLADWPFPINVENNIVQPSPFPRHTFAASYL